MTEVIHPDIKLINTDTGLIYVFDNVLSEEQLEVCKNIDWVNATIINGWGTGLNNVDLKSLEYRKYIKNTQSNDYFLLDMFFKSIDYFYQIDNDIKFITHCSSYYNINPRVENKGYGKHTDFNHVVAGWATLFFLHGESTPTVFYDFYDSDKIIKEIEFVPGRMVIFPGIYAHSAGNAITPYRVVHTQRYQIVSKLNDLILAKSSIKDKYDLNDYKKHYYTP